jgi:hypothetical protein
VRVWACEMADDLNRRRHVCSTSSWFLLAVVCFEKLACPFLFIFIGRKCLAHIDIYYIVKLKAGALLLLQESKINDFSLVHGH